MAVSTLATDDFPSVTSNLTAATNVTINTSNCAKSGKLISYNFRFTAGAEISENTDLITGFINPCGVFTGGATCVMYCYVSEVRSTLGGFLTANGRLRCVETIQSGADIRGSITYPIS